MKNIKSLGIVNFGDTGRGNRFNVDKLYQLMAIFSNVKCVHLFNLFLEIQISFSKLMQLCPNVKGLSVVFGNGANGNALVNFFGNNLHFLQHSHDAHEFIDFSNINFSKLTQLKLESSNAKTVNDILNSSKNLETVVIHPSVGGEISLNGKQLQTIIPTILKFKSLQYFEIEANDETFDGILNGIGKGLFETIKYEKK
eukprot:75387_1